MIEIIKNMVNSISTDGITFESIFLNNIQANLLIVTGGIFFSIFSFISLFVNGILIGFVGTLTPTLTFLLYVLPHGVFELPAIILSFTTALMITKLVIRLLKGIVSINLTLKGQIYMSKDLIKAIVMSLMIMVLLLIIAAFIEVYITPSLAEFILNILD